MGHIRRKLVIKTLRIFDLLTMTSAFALAAVLVSPAIEGDSFTEFLSMRIKVGNFILFFGFLVMWHLVFVYLQIYNSQRLVPKHVEAINIVRATSIGTLCISALAILFSVRMLTPAFLLSFWLISSELTVASRLLLRFTQGHIRSRGKNLLHILIAGTNSEAVAFARKLEARPESGYKIIGFVDIPWNGLKEFADSGYSLCCDFDQLPEFLRSTVVDEVVITLPMSSFYGESSSIAALCELHGIVVRFLPRIFNVRIAKPRAEDFEGDSLITLSTGPIDGWPIVFKRVLDFTLAFILLAFLAPLFLIVAVLIKLTSEGPVFFTQERLGLNKRRFRICKFRTMEAGAEKKQSELEHLNEFTGPAFKIKHDPRITPLGRILRKTSIDELPQLFNVLRGEMSLVGPRPLPVRDCEGFDQDWHRRRFSVRPGITCLWQISGRSSIGFDRWMELDMRYIDEWSLWLDFRILVGTIPAVLKGSGAA